MQVLQHAQTLGAQKTDRTTNLNLLFFTVRSYKKKFTNTKGVPNPTPRPEQVLLPRCFMHLRKCETHSRPARLQSTWLRRTSTCRRMQTLTNKSKYRQTTDLFMVALQHSPGTMSARLRFNPSERVKTRRCENSKSRVRSLHERLLAQLRRARAYKGGQPEWAGPKPGEQPDWLRPSLIHSHTDLF